MRRLVRLSLVLALALVWASAARAAESLAALLDPYFRIQTALTDDKTDGLKADATLIETHAKSLGESGQPIALAAAELSAATDLAAARTAFAKLSDAVIAYSEQTRATTGDDVAAMYCPMTKRSWLQKGTKVKNPYFGKAMPSCGEKKKTVA